MVPNEPIQLPTSYVGFDDVTVEFANSFLVQHQPGEFVITFGQVVPPPINAKDDDELRAQLSGIPFVPIKVLGRFGLPRERMVELIKALQDNLAAHDRHQAEEGR